MFAPQAFPHARLIVAFVVWCVCDGSQWGLGSTESDLAGSRTMESFDRRGEWVLGGWAEKASENPSMHHLVVLMGGLSAPSCLS